MRDAAQERRRHPGARLLVDDVTELLSVTLGADRYLLRMLPHSNQSKRLPSRRTNGRDDSLVVDRGVHRLARVGPCGERVEALLAEVGDGQVEPGAQMPSEWVKGGHHSRRARIRCRETQAM